MADAVASRDVGQTVVASTVTVCGMKKGPTPLAMQAPHNTDVAAPAAAHTIINPARPGAAALKCRQARTVKPTAKASPTATIRMFTTRAAPLSDRLMQRFLLEIALTLTDFRCLVRQNSPS